MFDQPFDYLNIVGNIPMINGFRYAIGDTPQWFIKISRRLVGGFIFGTQTHTGFESVPKHGLREGDQVKITPTGADSEETRATFNSILTVTKIVTDYIFTVPVKFKSGMRLEGMWQLADSYVAPITPLDVTIDNSGTNPATTGSNVVWYIAGGVALLGIGILAYKKFHK